MNITLERRSAKKIVLPKHSEPAVPHESIWDAFFREEHLKQLEVQSKPVAVPSGEAVFGRSESI